MEQRENKVPASVNDPFHLARKIKSRIRCCSARGPRNEEIQYLWIDLSKDPKGARKSGDAPALTLDEWLSVVDEASSHGVQWMIVTVEDSPSLFGEIWDVCGWAQRTHGMTVGLHSRGGELRPEDVAGLKRLELTKTYIFLNSDIAESMRHLESEGIQIKSSSAEDNACTDAEKRRKMLYVDTVGRLNSCGITDGHEDAMIGTVLQNSFKSLASGERTSSAEDGGNGSS